LTSAFGYLGNQLRLGAGTSDGVRHPSRDETFSGNIRQEDWLSFQALCGKGALDRLLGHDGAWARGLPIVLQFQRFRQEEGSLRSNNLHAEHSVHGEGLQLLPRPQPRSGAPV
ncbi:hypothetical protein PBRA_000057, partial [Plasmodiophora brassicae]